MVKGMTIVGLFLAAFLFGANFQGKAAVMTPPKEFERQGKGAKRGKEKKEKKEKEKGVDKFTKLTKGAKELRGLFTVYRKKGKHYLELRPDQLNRPFICGVTLEAGIGRRWLYSAMTLDEFIFVFRKVSNRIYFIRRNVHFRAKKGHPWRRAVERSFSDSILISLKVEAEHKKDKRVLVSLDKLLLSDIPALTDWLNRALKASYQMDKERSQVAIVKVFPGNVEAEAEYTFTTPRLPRDRDVLEVLPDPRSLTVRVHYSFAALPQNTYRPRLADPRVGYFVVAFKDFSDDRPRTPFVRYICRWHLEKKNLKAPLSRPKKPIVFWIENTTPPEYRKAIEEGVLMWNKAFRQAGFEGALEVRIMPDDADWDPADMRYNVIRWMVSHDASFAVGPSRVNPLTGEILDADIVIEANMVRHVKRRWRYFVSPISRRIKLFPDPYDVLDEYAWRPDKDLLARLSLLSPPRFALCNYGIGLAQQAAFGSIALLVRKGRPLTDEPPKEFIHAYLRKLVAHEVGHTLGLRHNFHGSTLLSPTTLHDASLTRRIGLSSSVMDYLPVNVAPPGRRQGEYWSSVVGPYDCWAIEYGYKPIPDAETPEEERPILLKIASRAPRPELAYGTDQDTFGVGFDLDPTIVRWDLSSDPMRWAKERIELVRYLWEEIEDVFPRRGEGYDELRHVFDLLLAEYGYSCFLLSRYIGGQYVHRDFPDDPGGHFPFVPVPAERQREALGLLARYLFAPDAFRFRPSLLNKLTIEKWWHWGVRLFELERPDYPLHKRLLQIQRRVLNRLFHPLLLSRIADGEWKAKKPFRLTELFAHLTEVIWDEVIGSKARPINSFRRNLQREHLRLLIRLLLNPPPDTPEDARTFARRELKRLAIMTRKALRRRNDPATRAHLEESYARIQKALDASIQLPPSAL